MDHTPPKRLTDPPDGLAVLEHVANRTIVAVLGVLHRLPVGIREDVLLLDHVAVRLRQLVDTIMLHVPAPRPIGLEDGGNLEQRQ